MTNIILTVILIAFIILQAISIIFNFKVIRNNSEQEKRSKRFDERMKQLNQEHECRISLLQLKIDFLKDLLK